MSGAETSPIASDQNGTGQTESGPTANALTGPTDLTASVLTGSGPTESGPTESGLTGATETATAETVVTGETETVPRTARVTHPWSARSVAGAAAENGKGGEAAAGAASTSGGETATANGDRRSSRKTRTAASAKTGPRGDRAAARATTTLEMPRIMAARVEGAMAATTARVSRRSPSQRGRRSMPRRPFCGGLIVPASAALDASHSSFLACKEQKDLFVSAVSCLVYCQKTSIVIPSMPPHSFFFFLSIHSRTGRALFVLAFQLAGTFK